MSDQKLDLLREVLPYIQRFKGKTFVVKLSGKVVENQKYLFSLAEELALLHDVGIRLCLVHGGGKQLNDLALQLGVEQKVINGRRITDESTLEMAKMIFAGKINVEILAALRGRSVDTVGLSGIDGNIIQARRRPVREVIDETTGAREQIDFGFVGDVLAVNDRLLRVLLDQNYLPVVSSLGADETGVIYNINADTIAAEIAVSLRAEKLILMSDIEGLRRDAATENTRISSLSVAQARAMIDNGSATGGMIPKLQAIASLLERGVKSAHIISGLQRNALLAEIFTDSGTGTMITI